MKNKKLGKILLCTTLALTTPFVMTACGKKSNNENPDNNKQEEQKQQQTETTAVSIEYAKDYDCAFASSSVTPYATSETDAAEGSAAVKAAIAKMIMQVKVQGELSDAEYAATLEQISAEVDTMIGNSVRPTESKKYVISVPETAIKNYDETKSLSTYYAEYTAAYIAKYAADSNNWKVVPDTGNNAYYNTTTARDVMVSYDYDSSEKEITIFVFSFESGAIEAAMEQSNSVEIQYAKDFDVAEVEEYESQNAQSATDVKDVLKAMVVGSDMEEQLTAMFESMPANIINVDKSKRYIITVPATIAQGSEESDIAYGARVKAYYEGILADYSAKYEGWSDMKDLVGDSEDIFYTTLEDENMDVMVSSEYDAASSSITIYVLSFAKGSINQMMNQGD